MSDRDTPLAAATDVERVGGCTLVTVRVRGDGRRAVRVENRLDGPVAPPRRAGVPERGWDERGFTGRLRADGTLSLGYAVPAPPADPPARVEPAADVPADDGPAAVLRRLGDPRPPAAALGDPTETGAGDGLPAADDGGERSAVATGDGAAVGSAGSPATDTVAPPTVGGDARQRTEPPAAVADWLDAVERRLDRAEALTDADVDAATAVLADAGGVAAVASLPSRLADDAGALRRVADRSTSLADRAAETSVPVEALRRLA